MPWKIYELLEINLAFFETMGKILNILKINSFYMFFKYPIKYLQG